MNISLSNFRTLLADLTLHVEVLIQHSENYYVVCRQVPKFDETLGGKAIYLTKQAIGSEIVSRLYRLIKTDLDAWNFPTLISILSDDNFLNQLMPHFDHDGRKSRTELCRLRDEVTSLFDLLSSSQNFKNLTVYRARFVAHRVPQPRDLKRFGAQSDVIELTSAELRWLTDGLSIILDKVHFMNDRGQFPADEVAFNACRESCSLWNAAPPDEWYSLKDVRDGFELKD